MCVMHMMTVTSPVPRYSHLYQERNRSSLISSCDDSKLSIYSISPPPLQSSHESCSCFSSSAASCSLSFFSFTYHHVVVYTILCPSRHLSLVLDRRHAAAKVPSRVPPKHEEFQRCVIKVAATRQRSGATQWSPGRAAGGNTQQQRFNDILQRYEDANDIRKLLRYIRLVTMPPADLPGDHCVAPASLPKMPCPKHL